MKSTILSTLTFASLVAAGWMGSFKYCRNNTTDTNPGCGTISFTENGCHQLPEGPQFDFTYHTHYIETLANVRCWGYGCMFWKSWLEDATAGHAASLPALAVSSLERT
ncbi:hypothetical protein GE09DRAFT_1218092 [Coniochaeta sp. 2T2.1]|nr:hypothetical protein GE09DRAFT_1218092 [Coniochaeta sp. 2T2.1]